MRFAPPNGLTSASAHATLALHQLVGSGALASAPEPIGQRKRLLPALGSQPPMGVVAKQPGFIELVLCVQRFSGAKQPRRIDSDQRKVADISGDRWEGTTGVFDAVDEDVREDKRM